MSFETLPDRTRLLRRLAWVGSGLALGLIVLGGVVRITGSGMGCGDHWPRCDGAWFPPLDLPTLIEIGHRWAAALVSLFVFAVALVAWRRHRAEPALRGPATLAAVLLVIQVLLGAITVKLVLPPWIVIVHLANAMVLLATLLVVALRAGESAGRERPLPPAERHRWHPLVLATAGLGFGVILFGAQVANFHAGLLCLGFPLCNGRILPPAAPLAALHWTHRVFAFVFLVVSGFLVAQLTRRSDPAGRALGRWAAIVLAVTVAQIGIAAAMVLSLLPPGLRAAHLLMGSLVWATLVVLVYRSGRTPLEPAAEPAETEPAGARSPGLVADLITLTKPRIISLLLVTTVAPMFITPAGLPSLVAGAVGRAGRVPDGRRGQRDQHVVRPGHRHPDDADPPAADPRGAHHSGLRPRVRRGPGLSRFRRLLVPGQPAERLAGPVGTAVLRLHLYRVAQALQSAEHRDRRRGRRVSTAGRMGRDDREHRSRGHLSVRHHLLLDAARTSGPSRSSSRPTTPGPAFR